MASLAHYKADVVHSGNAAAWAEAYLAEFSRESGTLIRFPAIPDRRVSESLHPEP